MAGFLDWHEMETTKTQCLDDREELYYLYAGLSGGASACVKVVGKTQAIAAFLYAARKVEHLLDHDTYYGKGIGYKAASEVDDIYDPTRDRLEAVALATQVCLAEEGMHCDDYDMLFVRAVIGFCQTYFSPSLVVAPPITIAATGRGNPESAMQVITAENANKPVEVKIINVNEIRNVICAANIMTQNATDVEKWHVLSATKYNGTGWTAVTDKFFPELQEAGQEKQRATKARDIQRLVENHRSNIGWVLPPNDDIY